MLLDVAAQPIPLFQAKIGKGCVAIRPRHRGELPEHVVQEEAQPDALALAPHPHQIHAVVPVAGTDQRQAMLTEPQAVPDGAHAMLIQAGRLGGAVGQVEVGIVIGVDRATFQEVREFIQHSGVATACHVAAYRQGQPEVVVRTVRAHAPARRRMPPVLDIALQELAARAQQQVFAHPPRLGVDERHHVLQLIAKAKGAARLVVAATRPDPACQGLVEQPAVGQHIDRWVGGFHLHRAERVVPVLPYRFERATRGQCSAEALHKLCGVSGVAADAKPEDDVARLSVGQVEIYLERGTGIQAGAHLAGKLLPLHGGRIAQRAVAPEKFRAVARQGALRVIHIEEGDPLGKLCVVRISRGERAAPGIDIGADMHGRLCA